MSEPHAAPQTFGQKISELREARGWACSEAARRAGISATTLRLIEVDATQSPTKHTLTRLDILYQLPLGTAARLHRQTRTATNIAPRVHSSSAVDQLLTAYDEMQQAHSAESRVISNVADVATSALRAYLRETIDHMTVTELLRCYPELPHDSVVETLRSDLQTRIPTLPLETLKRLYTLSAGEILKRRRPKRRHKAPMVQIDGSEAVPLREYRTVIRKWNLQDAATRITEARRTIDPQAASTLRGTVSAIENGLRGTSEEMRAAIALAYNLPAAALVFDREAGTPPSRRSAN